MSDSRQQVWIDAPLEVVWELIADVNRHPQWWPRVVDVQCDELAEGCTYREVVSTPVGKDEMELEIERLDDCEELAIRCINTGTFVQFALTEARGGTFVDGRMGMDPQGVVNRVVDTIIGQRYFRAWLGNSLDSMRQACEELAVGAAEREPET
ncbi:MAG: SRPBCC family protein [Solirubrobacterales bacterium]